MSRIYRVTDSTNNIDYLVRAHTRAAAIKHVARNIAAEVASQDDLLDLTAKGAKVQDATATVTTEEIA